MRSTATELGTPSTIVSSVRSSAWTPGNQVFQVASESWARTAAATLAQRSSAAGVPTLLPRVVHRPVHKCGEAVGPSTPELLGRVPRGAVGKFRAPGAGRGVGVADVTSAAARPTRGRRGHGPQPWSVKRRAEWSVPQVHGAGSAGLPRLGDDPYTALSACPPRARTATTATRRQVPGTSVPRRPRAHSVGPGFRGGHA